MLSVRLSVYVTLCAILLAPAMVRAQSTPSPQGDATTLDLTLDTGKVAAPAPRPVAKPAPPAAPRRAPVALASRGGRARQTPDAAPQVLAQLGLVVNGEAQIRLARDSRSRLLSAAPKGTYLAVVADGGDWWGVLMVNHTMGWVAKSTLQMIDYQTQVSVPADAQAAPQSRPAGGGIDQQALLGGLPADLDAHHAAVVREAMTYLGVPYVWAGNTRGGIDCSGFLKAVFASQGVGLPRHSGDQAVVGQLVAGNDLRPGDRLYFDMGNKGAISHCGLYLGNGLFIHASTNHKRVDIDSLFKPNYYRAFQCARR